MKGLKDVVAALVADGEPAHAGQPSERALDHPARAAQPILAFDPFAGDARDDAPLARGTATERELGYSITPLTEGVRRTVDSIPR